MEAMEAWRSNQLAATTTILDQVAPNLYAQTDEEASFRTHHVSLDPEVWDDFGRPDQITVTIYPGDKLNTEEGVTMELGDA